VASWVELNSRTEAAITRAWGVLQGSEKSLCDVETGEAVNSMLHPLVELHVATATWGTKRTITESHDTSDPLNAVLSVPQSDH
jgi:hypothetical protein